MANRDIRDALNDSIDRIGRGESIEDCLRAHPQHAAALRWMLEAGRVVQRAQVAKFEAQEAMERGRARIRDAQRLPPPRRNLLLRPLSLAASLLLVAALALLVAGMNAQGSLPGDALYSLKRLTESIQLSASGDSLDLRQMFAARRRDEIRQLLLAGREETVTFEGSISAKSGDTWLIAELTVRVIPTIPGASAAELGDEVLVEAITTRESELIATALTLLNERAEPTAIPTLSATPQATPSPTLAPSTTPAPTLTSSPTQSPSATSTVTLTLSPTPSRTSPPTVVVPLPAPTQDDDSGGNSGRGGSGNGNSGHGGSDDSGGDDDDD
jgi:uncharacterized membrane protein YgcG